MALSVSAMKQYIYPKIQELTTAENAHRQFCELICEYINKNVVITYSWIAYNASGTLDPVTVFTTNSSNTGYFDLSRLTEYTAAVNYWNIQMSNVIKTKMTVNIPTGWVLAPLLYSQSGLLNIIMAGETTFERATTNFCTQFLSDFKSKFVNAVPVAGTHGSYTGTATMTSIS